MIKVRYSRHAVMVWEEEKNRGIVYPATVSTDIELFTYEVRMIILEEMRNVRFVSLVFDPSFTRNYIPMRAFLNEKDPKCKKCNDGEEREMYDFLQYDDAAARELYSFFFEHAKKIVYPDGYIGYEFEKIRT